MGSKADELFTKTAVMHWPAFLGKKCVSACPMLVQNHNGKKAVMFWPFFKKSVSVLVQCWSKTTQWDEDSNALAFLSEMCVSAGPMLVQNHNGKKAVMHWP